MSNDRVPPVPERYEVLEILVQDEVEVLYRCRDKTLGREVLCKLPGIALAEHSGTDEKRALREVLADLEPDVNGFARLRRRAFDVAHSSLGSPGAREVLDWILVNDPPLAQATIDVFFDSARPAIRRLRSNPEFLSFFGLA